MALSSTALTTLRNCIKNNVSYARFKVGSTWYTANLSSVTINSSGAVVVQFDINHSTSGTSTVSAVELYDHNGNVWDSRTENISMKALQEGVLYQFTYTVTAT